MTKKVTKVLVAIMALLTAFSAVGCGGAGAGDRTQIEYRCNVSVSALPAYTQMVKAYNNGQGKIDGVYVNAAYAVASGDIGTSISSASDKTPNVVTISDSDFKLYASLGYLLDLDDYMTADVKTAMQWDSIPELMINRYSYNVNVDANLNKKTAGKGTSILGLPNGGIPSVLY